MDVEALLELISYKVVPLCFHTVAQAHEHLPIANDSLSRSRHAGMEASSAGDHLWCKSPAGSFVLPARYARVAPLS
jgi:hypothetical protein